MHSDANNNPRRTGSVSTISGSKLSRPHISHELKVHSQEFLGCRFESMLADLDVALFEQAGNSASNMDQAQFLEAMTLLRAERSAILENVWTEFGRNFEEYFAADDYASSANNSTFESHSMDDLQLVDQAEWEDDLAISILASRAESANTQALWALNQRLAVLCGGQIDESKNNPLGPIALAKAVQVAIADFDITEKAKSSVYAQFNTSVLDDVEKFLASCNNFLAEQGILPNLKYRLLKTESNIANGAPANGEFSEQSIEDAISQGFGQGSVAGAASQQAWPQSLRAEQQFLDAFINWQLQNLAINSSGITGAGVPLGPLFSANPAPNDRFTSTDYISVLNNLQETRKTQLEGGVVSAPTVTEFQQEFVGGLEDYAAEAANDANDKKVPAADASTIDLVGTIFNQILEEESLSGNVKALLSHLHTPFLKIALIDRRFMQEADHPARLLLNELAEAAAYWISGDEDKFKVYDKIYQVVHRIIDDFDDDIDFIDQLREDFDNFAERLQKRVELAEKRSSQAEAGLDKIEIAKKKAVELFARRAEAKSMPVAACDILEQTWVDFLVFVYLRFGAESETWKTAVMMLNQAFVRVHAAVLTSDDELASDDVEAALTQSNGTTSTAQAIAKLDDQLRSDILSLGYAEQDVQNMFELINEASAVRPEDEWREKHANRGERREKVVNPGIDIGAPEVDAELLADIKLEFEITQLDDDLDEQQQEVQEKLRNIEYGTWFEWVQPNGDVEKKLKLAWYSSMSDNYMFVNQAGVKVLVETLSNLTRSVHRGQIRVINIDNETFMERVFRKMVNNMQSSA